jgi:hypothetical protein
VQFVRPPPRLCRQSWAALVEHLRCFESRGTQEEKERRWLTTILAKITLRLTALLALFGLDTSSMGNVR